jgi:glycosyltransferase involved in cell wall biosynthesis
MRITLLNQFFWPDTVATSQVLTDLARPLAQKHKVTAICGGRSAGTASSSLRSGPEVTVVRTRNICFSHSLPARLASYVAYIVGAIWQGLRLPGPDSYVTLTTPPVLHIIGAVLGIIHRARHIIWEMDVYPDIATDIGYFRKNGIIDRVAGGLLDWSRRRADVIIVLGDEMKARVVARGIAEHKIHVAENWANGTAIVPMQFPDGPLTVHYSGNLGYAHEVGTIAAVMERLANHSSIRFIFSGGGPRRPQLECYCRERLIRNVEFRPFCANDQLGRSLAEGHLGLVTQIPDTLGSIVPSKIYGILAAGRPLLYIGPYGSTPAEHIRNFQCGWHIQPGDTNGLEKLLLHLSDNRHLLSEAGARSRAAFEQNYDLSIGVARILKILGAEPHDSEPMPEHVESVTAG